MAGVLLVFSFLIVPAVCAMIFFIPIGRRLLAGWGFGVLGSVAGLAASARWDFPTGASIVAAFGAVLICCTVVYAASRLRNTSGR